jgi:hypothetical protein
VSLTHLLFVAKKKKKENRQGLVIKPPTESTMAIAEVEHSRGY